MGNFVPERPENRVELSDCFTTEASASRAGALHRSYRALMWRQFGDAISAAGEGLGADLSSLSRRIESLADGDRVSPGAYVALTTLVDAMEAGDVTRVTDRIQAFSNLTDSDLADSKFRIQSALTESWELPFIESVRRDTVDGRREEARIVRALVGIDPRTEIEACETALRLLGEVDRELAGEFFEYVCRVKLFSGRGYLGFSSPAAFGAIYIRMPGADTEPVAHFLEHLVHELSHLALNVLVAHDPLLRNPDRQGPAPLRADARPLLQILHATFVLSRNVRVTRRVVQRHARPEYENSLRIFEENFSAGLAVLREHAEFTEAGANLFRTLESVCE